MHIIKKAISVLLILVIMFNFLPTEYMQPIFGAIEGNPNAIFTPSGTVHKNGGTVSTSVPVFRVMLSRDKENYLDGTSEARTNLINYYQTTYPNSEDLKSATLFLWGPEIFSARSSWSVGQYLPDGSGNLRVFSEPSYSGLNIGLSNTNYAENVFKTNVLNARNQKLIGSISDLSENNWKNYLPTYSQALNSLSYIFKRVGNTYYIDERIVEFCDKDYFRSDPNTLNESQKFGVAAGYAGLLACFYVVTANNPDLSAISGNYATALNDYFSASNIEEKPVSLIIDTAISITINGGSPLAPTALALPSMEFIEMSILSTESDSISSSEAFIKTQYPGSAGNTREMVKAMATSSAARNPWTTTYAGNYNSPLVRLVDIGGNNTYILKNISLGRIMKVPQFDHSCVRINSSSTAVYDNSKYMGFVDFITFNESLKGFIVVGNHVSNPIPELTFTVKTNGYATPDVCDREVYLLEPNVLTFEFMADSSLISSLKPRIDSGDLTLKTTFDITRTKSINGTVIESDKPLPELSAELTKEWSGDAALALLQGATFKLDDNDIMTEVYTREDNVNQTIKFEYNVKVTLTIDGEDYVYEGEDIVSTINGVTANYATYNIRMYGDQVVLPPDIEIPKPSSTMTTEVVNPSENENLYEMTQMIRRYEYTSRGERFAETKHNYPLEEEYEVMAGVPSSEEIYFSVGGSEYQLAMILQYWMNEHSRDRTYTMHFDSNVCEYNNQEKGKGDSWEGIDLPQAEGASQTTTRFEHSTGTSVNYDGNANGKKYGTVTVTATWTGTIQNEASPVTETKSTNHGTVTVNPKCPAVVNNSDYVEAVAQANAWLSEMAALTPNMKWTSASDKVERSVTIETMNIGSGDASTTQGDSGSGGDSFSDRGLMTGTISYSFSNPADTEASNSATANCTDSGDPPVHSHGSATATATAQPDSAKPYTITATYTISEHALCGPCCEHVLPDLYDMWRQGLVYDFVKISQIRLYKLDQGVADGFEELTGTDKYYANIVSGNPTYFHNIAQLTEINKNKILVGIEGNRGLTTTDPERDALTYYGGTDIRRVSQSSRDGRLRYILDPNMGTNPTFNFTEQGNGQSGSFIVDYNKVAAPEQHDDVIYTIDKRSKNCDGMATTNNFGKQSSNNAKPMETTGHNNDWADGCLYVNLFNDTNYENYWNSNSIGYSYVPQEQRENDANAIGTLDNGWTSKYYEDYNHHIVRDGGSDKSGYSDKADNKDTQTAEWKCFDAARRTKIIANVISDFLILQTSGGDQSIFYYEKATPATEAQEHFQKLKITEEEIFDNNPLSIFNGVSELCKNGANGNLKDEKMEDLIVVGGYNGQYNKPEDKYKPYSLVTHEFLPFGGWPTYDATEKTGDYEVYGGYAVKTILDDDPANTISRPIRESTSQETSFKILQDKIRILPTTANQIYEPANARVWYHQELGYFSMDTGVLDAFTGEYYIGCVSQVEIGLAQRLAFGDRYREDWGTSVGVDYEAKYFITPEGDESTGSINPIVVHTPVSTEYAMVLQQPDLNIEGTTISRDQRVDDYVYPDMNEVVNNLKVCPLDPGSCEYRYLNCKYTEPTILADFDFSSTYETTEKQIVDGKLQTVKVTKKNTYQENGKWITTNKITGVEYTLPSGFTIENVGKVGEGSYLRAQGSRWSIPFSSLGLANDKTNNIQINMDLTVESSNNNNIMLIGFQNYGFILNSESGFIRSNLDGTDIKSTNMVGNLNYHNVHLSLTFGFNSIIDAKATVNGKEVSVTRITEVRNVWETVDGVRRLVKKNVVLNQNNFDKDAPETFTRSDIGSNVNIGSWGGATNYTANFYLDNLQIVLLGGTMEHNSNCYESVTIHATSMVHTHTDDCYAKEDLWTCDGELNANYQHSSNYANNAHVCDSSCKQAINSGISTNTTYKVIAGTTVSWGSSGHVSNNHDWPIVYINGSRISTAYSGSYTFTSDGTVNWSIQTPCQGGAWCTISGYINQCSGILNTHKHIGTPGLNYSNGCYTVPTEHIHNNIVKKLTCTLPEGGDGKVYNFSYTGNIQSVDLPAGRYLLEVWGAAGGNFNYHNNSAAGLGGYSKGEFTLNSSDTLYVAVGGKGQDNLWHSGGGWNGGGAGAAPGGGATHIALRTGLLSSLSNYKSDILLVAGGGAGSSGSKEGGAGGGANQSGTDGGQHCGTKGTGGTLFSGGTSASCGNAGSFGQGGSNTCSGGGTDSGSGGGGGYYGGGAGGHDHAAPQADDSSGGGGSGYANTSKLSNISGSTGVRSGDGFARITNLNHQHTDACYSITQSTCDKIPAGSLVCTGELNTVSDFNVHNHTVDCLTTAGVGVFPTVSFQAINDVQTYKVPWTDTYTIEVYGPGVNNRSGYAKAEVKLKAKDTLYIYVGDNSGYNNRTTDVRLIKMPTLSSSPGDTLIQDENIKNSQNSRLLYATTTSGSVSSSPVGSYTLKNLGTGIKGNTGGGRVVITPKNSVISPTIFEQIVNGTMPPDEAKDYIGDTLYDKIVKDSEKVLHTWSGWSTSNDKGFKAINQCTLTMNGNLVVKSTGVDPHFDVKLDSVPYQAITQIKVYLNNPVSNKGQIFLKDASGTYNEVDSVWSNSVTVGASNQVMTFDLRENKNFSGNFTGLRFDLGSAVGTMTITKIEVYGYGSKQSGTGEASLVNTEQVVATAGTKWNFAYTGGVQSKTLEKGKYKLEVWGASGGGDLNQQNGSHAGLGGYSVGEYLLSQSQTLHIYVGGQGQLSSGLNTGGGYNGGGHGGPNGYGGGGMTHISTTNNLAVANGFWNPSGTLIVAGGGGGSDNLGGALGPGGYSQQTILYSNASMIYSDSSGYTSKFDNNGNGFTIGWEGSSSGGSTIVQINNPYNSTNATSMTLTMRGYKDSDTPSSIYGRFYIGYGSPNDSDFYTLYDSGNHNVYANNAVDTNLTIDLSSIPAGNVIKFKAVKYGSYYRYHFALTNIRINTFIASDDGSGGSGGGLLGGNAYVEGILKSGSNFIANAVNGGGCGIGGTQTTGYRQGIGESVTYSTDTGGAGAGWFGGYVTNHSNGGGAGGSGYIGGVSNGSMQNGVRSGNGYATITALEDIKTGGIEYKFTPLKITYRSPLQGSENIINANLNSIPEYVNGDYNPIWVCKMQPKNAHVCEMIDEDGNVVSLCRTITTLNCNEPHHRGEHYTGSNDICWDACGDDSNHKNTHTDVVDENTGENLHLANFLQLDDGFTIYFPNRGNFAGSDPTKLGLASPTTDRCLGYTNNMDTTDWTREKRVKFPFDVIYEDQIYFANTWIDLDVPTEYFNFYLLVSNNEQANGSVEFECEAINCNSGVGLDVAPNISYGNNISTDYADALNQFLDGYLSMQVREVNKGYQVPIAIKGGNTTPETRPFGQTGYENFYIEKEKKEQELLDTQVFDLNKQIENEFEGGNEQNRYINPHTYSEKGINYELKPITSNDNKLRVDNRMRMESFESLHGGYKHFYIDVIGRIGNLAIVDTEDFRFSNFFKMPIISANDTEGLADAKNWLVEGLVLNVDDSIQNWYVGDSYDIHGNKVDVNTRWLDTYGTESWMAGQIRNGERNINYPNLVSQILTGDLVSSETLQSMGVTPGMDTYYDNTDILKLEQMRYGYDAYTSIVTYGNYGGGKIQVIPKYYALKTGDVPLDNQAANDFLNKYDVGDYIELDVYINKDGIYTPINLFDNASNSQPNKNDLDLYDYIFNLDWTSEANRRNYTMDEKERTLRVRDYFKQIVYDIPEEDLESITESLNPDFSKYPIKDIIEYDVPNSKYNLLGTPQYILMDSIHRTFIGDSHSYGNEVWDQIATIDASVYPIDKNIDDAIEDIYFERAVQRWHGKIGLPSSAVLVPKEVRDAVIVEEYGAGTTISDLTSDELDEIIQSIVNSDTVEYIMNDNYAIVCTAEFISVGDVWSLYYSQPWYRTLNLYGKDLIESELQGKDVYKSFEYSTNLIGDTTGEHYPGHLVNGKLCPSCLPPILAVYSSSHSSVEDIDIVGTH